MKFEGKISYISPELTVGKDDKKTVKRVLCLKENSDKEFVDSIAIDFMSEKKIELLKGLEVGMIVEVLWNVSYNRFDKDDGTEAIFNSIKGWRINVIDSHVNDTKAPDDDLPFN